LADHYFSRSPEIKSNPIYWDYQLKNHSFHFKSDAGVFSKKEVDFGSRLLIESFRAPRLEGPVLDVGCGYGPIGLAVAAYCPERTVHMVDINLRALSLAKENADMNGIENVQIYESDGLDNVKEYGFAAILTNPPIRAGKAIVHRIFSQSYDKLQPGGEFWAVIQKKQGAPSAMRKLEELFQSVSVEEKKKGYYVLKAEKH
jgi:16S rRNA (guanine1207-N2)-methyltransferase